MPVVLGVTSLTGYTAGNMGFGTGNVARAMRFTAAANATVDTLEFYFDSTYDGDARVKLFIANTSGTRLGLTSAVVASAAGGNAWVGGSITSFSIVAGQQYDIGLYVDNTFGSASGRLGIFGNGTGCLLDTTSGTYTAPPTTFAFSDDAGSPAFAIRASATVTPATLSSPTPSGTIGTATTATIGATTDQASGTAYAILSTVQTDVTTATDANVIAGQKAGGATTINNNAAVSSTTISIPITGLTAGTTYYASTIQVNSNGNSTRANTSFTTAAAAPSSAFNFDCASTGVAATTFAADAGASRVVVAVLSHEQTNGTRPVASLVVGGATFQKLTDAIFGQGTSYAYTEIWYCLESSIASIGANPSVTVTATSTGNKFVSGTLFTIANVQQSAASWVQGVDAKAIGTDLSATLATVIGRQIVGGATATIGGNAFTTGASVTEITGSDRNFNSSASRAVSFYGVASGTSTTVTTGNTNSNTAMSQSMVAVAFPALSGRSIGITLRDAGAVGQPVLNNQTRKFWTRTTLDGAAVDGGSAGISITCGTDGVFILSGLTIAAGAGYLTMADPADPSKSHNFFVTYV